MPFNRIALALLKVSIAKPMSEKEETRWRRRRAGGRRAFIWMGVLVFGGLMFVSMLAMFYMMGDRMVFDPRFASILLVICLLGGWWFGRMGWDAGEFRLANTLWVRGQAREAFTVWQGLATQKRFAKDSELRAMIEEAERRLATEQHTAGPV